MSSGIRRPAKKQSVRRAAVPRPAPPAQETAQPVETRASTDYTLMSSTRTRTHNVMRFLSPTSVDLTTFTPPVKMRRRNRDYFRLKNKKRNEERVQSGTDLVEETVDAEPELDSRPKADMNLIADVGGARRNKRNLFKKKTKQVYFADEEKRRLDIEEARPWVLEDDDESHVWTGDLEGGQNASAYVLFVLADDGFRVVPVDRWYKFAPKLKYRTMTLDEAEEELTRMQKSHAKRDLWIMRRNAEPEQETDAAPAPAPLVEYEANVFGSDSDHDSDSGAKKKAKKVSNKHGAADEIEFEMEFDDDEELGDVRFEFNEEEAGQERGPTAFYAPSDDEEEAEPTERGAKEAKALKKLVRKREDKGAYASDREENPYLSEEESESEESDAKPEPEANADVKPETPVKPEPPKLVPRASTSSGVKKRKRPLAPTVDTRPKHHKPTTVITQQEIVDLIRSGVSTTKDLIIHVRKKLKADPQNQQRIHAILKQVATLKEAIAASGTTVAMIASQLTVVGHVRRAYSMKTSVAMLQPLASFVSSILWLKYGLLRNDHVVSLVNVFGVCVSLWILLAFWRFSHSRHSVETRVLLALFVSMVCVGFVTMSDQVWAHHVYSIMCCVVSLVFLASPLGQLGQVLRARDASVLLPSVTGLAF
ncbi:transcription factor IIF subunit tfg1, partial [Coemansia sp. RSA 2440]